LSEGDAVKFFVAPFNDQYTLRYTGVAKVELSFDWRRQAMVGEDSSSLTRERRSCFTFGT
jgi:hypothetical protein